jgi:hypothetical protein
LLYGTGTNLVDGGKWLGDTPETQAVLGFYSQLYGQGLGDPKLQLRADGRDRSFAQFAESKIAVLLEGDYFWRGVINPDGGLAPMKDRDQAVGWALIPARQPGGGLNGQDFVSLSGGAGRVINPNTKSPKEAWELLKFLNSKEALTNPTPARPPSGSAPPWPRPSVQTTSPAPADAAGGAQPPQGRGPAAVLGRPAAGAFVAPALLLIAGFLVFPALWTLYLVLAGGLLPAAIFILKDFTDTTPTSYEESARVFGASPFQILRDVVVPLVRPGMAVIAVWTIVNVWGNFLIPFILLRDPNLAPSVVTYSFYTEGGQADLRLLSAFSLLYSVPVVVMYLFVQRRYGFRFYGGIKR